MKTLQGLPFLRLLIFLCIGILAQLVFPSFSVPVWSTIPLYSLTIICALYASKHQYRWRWLFGLSLASLIVIVGMVRTHQTQPIYWERSTHKTPFIIAELTEFPTEKRATYAAVALLHGEEIPEGSQAMLYIAQDSASQALSYGDLLMFPRNVAKGGNNNTDYDRYLRSIGCSGSIYIPKGRWRGIGNNGQTPLFIQAQETRRKVIKLYSSAGLTNDELAIVSALTLGDKSHLSQEIKSSYAATGASHILAVSGLHVGIIYLVIISLLGRILPGNSFKAPRIILTLTILWGYAFIAGFSASVVRASIMLSLVAIGEMMGRKAVTLNTLFASAFCMLLYHPRYLTEVGFQLSYTAVISILLLQEKIYKTLIFKSFIPDKIWSLTSVSIAAQLGTLPIVLYHFHRFSNLFWLSGLIVIPAATLLIYICALLLVCSPFPTLATWIGVVVKHIAHGMNQCILWMENLPHASVEGILFESIDLLLLYAILAAILSVTERRSFLRIATMLTLTLLYASYQTILKWRAL